MGASGVWELGFLKDYVRIITRSLYLSPYASSIKALVRLEASFGRQMSLKLDKPISRGEGLSVDGQLSFPVKRAAPPALPSGISICAGFSAYNDMFV